MPVAYQSPSRHRDLAAHARRCTIGRAQRDDRATHRTAVRVETIRATRTIVLSYEADFKRATKLTVEDGDDHGSRLVVTEHYPVIGDDKDPRVAEVDRSLIPWVDAIRRHLLGRERWGWLPGWRWWNERFLPGMVLRQRRIVRMIVWVSLIEFVVFLFVAAIFWLERQRG